MLGPVTAIKPLLVIVLLLRNTEIAALRPLPGPAAVLIVPAFVILLSLTTCMPMRVKEMAPEELTVTALLSGAAMTLGAVPTEAVQVTVVPDVGAVLSQSAQALVTNKALKPKAK
ncbi:hypothetical protein D3C81_1721730 [compost metagenome]